MKVIKGLPYKLKKRFRDIRIRRKNITTRKKT